VDRRGQNNTSPSATSTPFNAYRFNAMRWDSTSGQHDMGFRTYAPGLTQFLTRDMYNGALADVALATDPFTGNRYTLRRRQPHHQHRTRRPHPMRRRLLPHPAANPASHPSRRPIRRRLPLRHHRLPRLPGARLG